MVNQSSSMRIGSDVFKLISKILFVANAMFVESCLPDLSAKLCPQAMRKAALDALGATLNRLTGERSEKHMQVFRHDDEPMEEIATLIPVAEQGNHEQLRINLPHKESAPLIGRSRQRVSAHGG